MFAIATASRSLASHVSDGVVPVAGEASSPALCLLVDSTVNFSRVFESRQSLLYRPMVYLLRQFSCICKCQHLGQSVAKAPKHPEPHIPVGVLVVQDRQEVLGI